MNISGMSSVSFNPRKPDVIFSEVKGKVNPLELYGARIPGRVKHLIHVIESAIEIANYTWNYFGEDVERTEEMASALENITIKIAEANIENPSNDFEYDVMKMIPRNPLSRRLNYETVIYATGLVQIPKDNSSVYIDPTVSLTESIYNHMDGCHVYERARKVIEQFSSLVCSDRRELVTYRQHLLIKLIITSFGQLDKVLCDDINSLKELRQIGGEVINYLIGRKVASEIGISFDFTDYRHDLSDDLISSFFKMKVLGYNNSITNTAKLAELVSKQTKQPPSGGISTNPFD